MKMKILITVKTYPTPSRRYREIICTAGVLEDGSWIRLYPISYRYKDYSQWYKKYQWVEVEVKKHVRDSRLESYMPIGDIKVLGKPLSTKNRWAERKKYILVKRPKTMCSLEQQSQKEISLAVVKPKKVIDFYWESTDRDWSPKQETVLKQLSLFEKEKPLEKIPYKFVYHFICEEVHCKGHKMMIEDWEVMELYRKMKGGFGERKALNKVKEKFLGQVCFSKRDPYFFVGTVLKYGTWIIIGVFWPPKT